MISMLIVDDTESWRELLTQELEDAGYRVEKAESAESALQEQLRELRRRFRLCADGPGTYGQRYGWRAGNKSDPRPISAHSRHCHDGLR